MNSGSRAISGHTPLWIISVFIGLSEAVAGLIATQADGWVAAMLAVFAVAYPVIITGLFFRILLTQNWLLYSPADYSSDVQPDRFVETMRAANRSKAVLVQAAELSIESAIQRALSSMTGVNETEKETIVQTAVEDARTELHRQSVTVDRSVFGKDAVSLFVDASTTVSDFLNELYFQIDDYVGPFRYGIDWILEDQQSNERWESLGSRWANARRMDRDNRLLADVGIRPGSELRISNSVN